MKKILMDILCCTVCKGDIKLIIENQEGDNVINGSLYCPNCELFYKIENGIPNMLPPISYKHT